MAGMNRKLSAQDKALGYDDDHKSTDDSRRLHWVIMNSMNAQLGFWLSVDSGNVISMRTPNKLIPHEQKITDLVEKTLTDMTKK
jgi:hypothetical protein